MIELERSQKIALGLLVCIFIIDKVGFFLDPAYDADLVLTSTGQETVDSGNRLIQGSIAVTVFLFAFYLRGKRSLRTVILHPVVLLYSCLVLSSVIYSTNIDLTLRRVLLWFAVLYIGAGIVSPTRPSVQQVILLFYYFGLIYVFIATVAFIRSVVQLHPFFQYPFTVFDASHRDAEVLVITLLLHWYATKERLVRMSFALRMLLWGLIPILLILSLSRTSLSGLVIAGLYVAAVHGRALWRRLVQIALVIGVLLVVYLLLSDEAVQGIVRIESAETLMGRTILWQYLLSTSASNEWIGTGYGAFWSSSNIYDVQASQGWAAPVSHNGFIDVYLNTGLVGLLLILLLVAILWKRARTLTSNTRIVVRALLIFIIVQNLTQGSFQNPRMYVEIVFWWMFMSVIVTSGLRIDAIGQHGPMNISDQGSLAGARA